MRRTTRAASELDVVVGGGGSLKASDGARMRGAPAVDAVVRLAEAVERAVRIERWIGKPDDRKPMLDHMLDH